LLPANVLDNFLPILQDGFEICALIPAFFDH